jgi:competence transcription factor ComK
MAVAIDVKGKNNENINISHSIININNIIINVMNYGLNIDELVNRIVKELQQRAPYDPRALEALKMVQQLVEELRKANSRERKLSIFKKILEIVAPIVDLFRIFADMLSH